MKQLNVYSNFPGTYEAALDLYKKAFNDEIISLQRYGDSPVDTQEDYKQKIMTDKFGVHWMLNRELEKQ